MDSAFSEQTTKLKTQVLIFGEVSLFVGLSQTLPTKISLIGLDLEDKGHIVVVITSYVLIHFLILSVLDIIKFFKKHIINVKSMNFTGDTWSGNLNSDI